MKLEMKKYSIVIIIYICAMTSFGECKVFGQISDSLTNKEIVYYITSIPTNSSTSGTHELPFSSLEQARDAVRESRKKSLNRDKQYRIILLSGIYKIKNCFALSDKDSGTVHTPIIYEGEKKGKVILNGGITIPLKKCQKIAKNNKIYSEISSYLRDQIYCVDLKKILSKEILQKDSACMNGPKSFIDPVELCINDEMMTLARYPDTGFARTASSIDSLTFKFDDKRIRNWKKESFPLVLGYLKYGWSFSFNRISIINENEKTIALSKNPSYGLGNNRPFFISNILSELDAPKEYYIDYQSSLLYFILPHGLKLSKSKIELSRFGGENNSMIEMNKTSNITIRNISFALGRFGAINIKNCNSITLFDLEIYNMGNFGIKATGIKNKFVNLNLTDLGGSAIDLTGGNRLSLVASDNLITNCRIERIGRIQRTFNPGILIGGVGNTIRNCQISHLPNLAIAFTGNENIIEKNEIFDVCNETCDAGAIYSGRDWASRGNIIQYNYIHDINSINKEEGGVHGIYLDDCASGIMVESNIISNIDAFGVFVGGGRDNIITGNIITNCGTTAILADKRGVNMMNLKKDDSCNLKEKIEKLNYKSEIWSLKYPKLATILDNGYEEAKLPYGNEVKENIMWENKVNFKENNKGAFQYFTISNNKELNKSPFPAANVKEWTFDSNLQSILPHGFKPIPVTEIGLLKSH
jgi:parallel beta-helix repeat protein